MEGAQEEQEATYGQIRTPQWVMCAHENDQEEKSEEDQARPHRIRAQKDSQHYRDRIIVMHGRPEVHQRGEKMASRSPEREVKGRQSHEQIDALSPVLRVDQERRENNSKIFTHDGATQRKKPPPLPFIRQKQERKADKKNLYAIEMAFPCNENDNEGIQGIKE